MKPPRRDIRGFTLFEILVAVAIIAIGVGVLLPQISWIQRQGPAEKTALKFADTLELLRDEAALQGRNFGVRFEPDGYEILDLDPDTGAWLTISDDKYFAPSVFDNEVTLALVVEDRDIKLEQIEDENDVEQQLDAFGNPIETATQPPHIVVLTSGEMTPFELAFERFGSDEFIRLDADAFGELELLTERP
ncbi:MAG: type II secretion system minor pseudopilin GspH [Pseudomonadota bacterium]